MRLHELFCVPASVVCTAWGIPYALRPDGFADPEASSMQVQTHVLTTGSPTRIQTWNIGSPKLDFGLPPWLTN
eukprot:9118769-Ditylum_brightwellii.AAC.1